MWSRTGQWSAYNAANVGLAVGGMTVAARWLGVALLATLLIMISARTGVGVRLMNRAKALSDRMMVWGLRLTSEFEREAAPESGRKG